ncbi:MAG: hypothetical protein ACO2PM_11955 [Pyrobaculum sp.]
MRSSVSLVSHRCVLWAVLTIAFLISALYLTLYLAALFIKQIEQGVVLALTDGTCKIDALRSDGRAADVLLELFTKHPEARLKLAQVVAGSIAVPLNVATKDDIKAAVEELKRWAEEKFATKEDLKQFATKQDFGQLKK